MRSPADLGLPARFTSWRRGQDAAVRSLLFTDTRFNLLCIPTGGGKTVTYMAHAAMHADVMDGRHVVLTATRALQDQVSEQFSSMGLVDMRGRSNYTCDIEPTVTAAEAKCTGGVYCERMRNGGCGYYDQRDLAGKSELVVSNYRFWLHDEESGSLGDFNTVVLDEAHKAPDEISDYASLEFSDGDLKRWNLPTPPLGRARNRPFDWAASSNDKLEQALAGSRNLERRREIKTMQRKLSRLCRLSDSEWLSSMPRPRAYRWDLVDPGGVAEQLLFRGAKRVILVSASIRRKTLKLLGVDEKVRIVEHESTFPVRRRPIYYWPVAHLGKGFGEEQRQRWFDAIDEIIAGRLDRNGVIHCHSYDRGWDILKGSGYRDRMLLHKRGEDGAAVVDKFRAMGRRRPTILVSPAVGTGIDLPYTDAEFQIIPKVPFPDMTSPLVKARMSHDSEYIAYVTMQTIVQMIGRGNRFEDDSCEHFILDDNFGWLRGRYWDFAPNYFHAAVRTVKRDAKCPDPLPKLERRVA